MKHARTLAWMLVSLVGCKRPQRAAPTARPTTAATVAEVSRDAGGPRSVPGEVEARAVLEQWLGAQNQGDFTRYQSLYAARFAGIKRAGERTRSYDRPGWIADRQAMFASAMRVEVSGVEIQAGAAMVVLTFTQRFTQGNFHDEGPKRMVLAREGTSLRIAREEMVRSELGAGDERPAAIAPGAFFLTVEHHGVYAVLHTEPEPGWSEGAPMLISRDEVVVTRKNARLSALPQSLAALRGRSVRVYGRNGALCTGTLQSLVVLHRVDVHFGTEQRWDGTGDEPGPRYSAEQIAADAWGVGTDGALLAGEIDPTEGTCTGAQWARVTDLAEPAVYVPTEATGALATTALTRFRQLPAWLNAQESYRSAPPDDAGVRWDGHGGAHPTVTLWQTTPPGRRYVSVVSNVSAGGCADFSARVSAVFEVVGSDLVLQTDPNDPGVFDPQAATDADGDGTADFITPAGLFRRRGTVLRWVDRIQWPVLDCYC